MVWAPGSGSHVKAPLKSLMLGKINGHCAQISRRRRQATWDTNDGKCSEMPNPAASSFVDSIRYASFLSGRGKFPTVALGNG